MHYVYVIKSLCSEVFYVGMSKSVELRLQEYNFGRVHSTKRNKPWRMVYKESVSNLQEARKREKYLKSAAGRKFRKKLGL